MEEQAKVRRSLRKTARCSSRYKCDFELALAPRQQSPSQTISGPLPQSRRRMQSTQSTDIRLPQNKLHILKPSEGNKVNVVDGLQSATEEVTVPAPDDGLQPATEEVNVPPPDDEVNAVDEQEPATLNQQPAHEDSELNSIESDAHFDISEDKEYVPSDLEPAKSATCVKVRCLLHVRIQAV